ncbi:3-oxoacyl-ACP synthase III family protein [Streptomyces sp. NPDC053560]|uniref:3-oxoacyl-ACP synthase III family protein n=1 Tax=Streptomyces sp. NPDC053560 TaxID=3365711 RepID=UPI0037D5CE3E
MRPTVAHIAAIGTALPGEPVDNESLGRLFGVSGEWVDIFVGTRTRHFARDITCGTDVHSLTDLCVEAADRALAAARLEPSDIDFLVLSTMTPDMLLPTTATRVADRLGLNYVPAYQLHAGCSGPVQILELAQSLIRSGRHAGLAIGGDVMSRCLDVRRNLAELPTEELVNYLLLGDGAGAAVLTAEPLGERLAVRGVLHQFAGRGRPSGQVIDCCRYAARERERVTTYEDHNAIEESVPSLSAEIMWDLLDSLGWNLHDVSFLLPPQLSGRMTERVMKHLDVTGVREVSCVTDTGNTGNALAFLQAARLLPDMRRGQRALSLAVESSNWIKAGLALERV